MVPESASGTCKGEMASTGNAERDQSPVGLAPGGSQALCGSKVCGLYRMEVIIGAAAFKKLIADHGKCVHIHLAASKQQIRRCTAASSIHRSSSEQRCLQSYWFKG